MYTSVILDLRYETNWEPARLTAESFRWPSPHNVVSIQSLAGRIYPNSIADAGAPVITPVNLNTATGGIRHRSRQYQGVVFQVGRELEQGDVVVPRTGLGPALRISKDLQGALVSSRFIALRPYDSELSAWIWAVLNCETGLRMRSHLSMGFDRAGEPQNLLDARIPIPSTHDLVILIRAIDAIEAATHAEEEQPIETWWSIADLRNIEWRIALATPQPERLQLGPPLSDYCKQINRGRNTRIGAIDFETPGYLPVLDVSVLGGKSPRRWLSQAVDNELLAQPGDLVLAGIGQFAYATVVMRSAFVDRNVYLLQLHDQTLGPAIAGFLNSRDGYALRQLLLRGSTVPAISKADIGSIPIASESLECFTPSDARSIPPLSQRLEQALWQT